ncbi:MAG: CRISPR-associated protein Cas4 [Thaumarchaeota archaeon]|nr:CRISPR-associated protein Cas4 [Nitrososphaerota archaeon]
MLESGKIITGTIVWYYFICKREVWLMSRELAPDQDFAPLEIGRAIHEIYYERDRKELSLEGIKLDVVRSRKGLVFEVKTSSRFLQAAKFQLLYYLYRLEKLGVKMRGEIRIPKERKRIIVELNDESRRELLKVLREIREIVGMEKPPKPIKTHYCRRCAYKEFCWI